jgi:tetratricopeptide (TPR) repeat protein
MEVCKYDREKIIVIVLVCAVILFICGCGASWQGRIVYLKDGKLLIKPEGESEIESGRKALIYREKTLTHPVTGEVLGNIEDRISQVPVVRVRNRTVTAVVKDPEFSMIEVGDQATAVRGSVKPMRGTISQVGNIDDLDTEGKTASITVNPDAEISAGQLLTAVRYADMIMDLESEEILAVSLEPVATLKIIEGKDGYFKASYELMDGKLGWVEIDDPVVKRTGEMAIQSLWFQDPPADFAPDWLYKRNYLRAIRHFNAGQYREALLELEDVAKTNPEYEDTTYLLGNCYVKLNRYEEAIAHFRDNIEREPDDLKSLMSLAYVYIKQNNLTQAVELYERITKLLTGNPGVWVDMGDLYQKLGEVRKAEQAYRKALELDKNSAEAEYELRGK